MSDICFRKDISTSTHFLRKIWYPKTDIDEHKHELHRCCCSSSVKYCFVNDFVNKRSWICSKLQPNEAVNIHVNNVEYLHCNTRDNKSSKDEARKSDIESYSGPSILKGTSLRHSIYNTSKTGTPEDFLTDEFLNKLLIPQGEKRRRLEKCYKESKSLFIYLSYHLGSEFMVKARRMIFEKQYNHDLGMDGHTIHISGSKAEGLDMAGSDTDLMVMIGNAYENNGENVTEDPRFMFDSSMADTYPGYVLLKKIIHGRVAGDCPSGTLRDGMLAFERNSRTMHSVYSHGPSLANSMYDHETDRVIYLKCKSWPKIARPWILRKRRFGWPSQEMINDIVQQGCYIVPVGSTVNIGSENAWRLSFNLAEKYLVFTFNHTQLMIYGLLKVIRKEILSQHEDISELLCSYFLKTTIFWVIEENKRTIWVPKYMMLCFHLCLERLRQFIIAENCPNYFVPTNNMFKGRFPLSCCKDKLVEIVCEVSKTGLNWTWESPTMRSLKSYLSHPYKLLDLKTSQKRKDQIGTASLILNLRTHSKTLINGEIGQECTFLQTYIKSLLRIPVVRTSCLAHLCHYIDTNNTNMENKTLYALRKLYMKFICLGCRADLASGKLLLASWLYNQGKFKECLLVSDVVLKCLDLRVIHGGLINSTECSNHVTMNCPNFIKNLNYFSTTDVQFIMVSKLVVKEISAFYRSVFSVCSEYTQNLLYFNSIFPDSYCYFLRYLCHFRLGNIQGINDEFSEMERVKFIGTKLENMKHEFNMNLMKYIKNLIINQTDNDWKCEGIIFTDVLEKLLPLDSLKGDFLDIMHQLGGDPIALYDMWEHIAKYIT